MSAGEIHVGDIGTVFEVTIMDGATAVNISGATTKELIFQLPDKTTKLTKTAVFKTDGVDGKLKYTTVAGDLSVAGSWQLQAYIVLTTGGWRSDIGPFTVFSNL